MKLLYWLCILGLCALAARAGDERILLNATINGKTARMVFDTGASDLILFKRGAERLGLRVTEPPRDIPLGPGEVTVGRTEECDFVLGATHVRTAFRVFEPPSFLHMGLDGAVGWQAIRYNTIRIDAARREALWLTNAPPETASWLKLRLRRESRVLTLEIPGQPQSSGVLTLDTGSSSGIALSPERWRAWRAGHTNAPTTLMAGYMPGAGTVVTEESWAKEMAFGPLVLTEVPVMPANVAEQAMGAPGFEGCLGLAALKRLELVVDGILGIAYLQPKTGPAPSYEHNRLGAVFAPRDTEALELVAHVIDGSPAYQAGVRDGDILLKVDDVDATQWRTDPRVLPLSRFWEQPPGTKVQLTLRRATHKFKVTATLRQILGPRASAVATSY